MLLGNSIDNLSASELAVILLSAYWHDLGMVCNDIEEIKNEEWFDEYIDKSYKYDGNLTPNIVSEYIRLNHHKRLEKYLYDTSNILNESEKDLFINEYDVIDMAYKVSMSHNENTKDLEKFKEYQSNHNQDDFIFCAILLRLADVMDFDNDRTANSSYKFLGLENPINSENQFSQKEWKKHLDSLGFSYNYENKILYFKAIPKDPDTEFYIREFVKIIENELNKCTQLFNSHCHKWRDVFKLPYEIDISGINSKSRYKFGDYKFSFDNNQVLDLLTGNNIYSDPMIFVRELLQNSIDASLYRETLEKEKGKSDFKCEAINVTDWHDKDGNYWIRFDDYGLGMDEYVLLNYFTKIGKSFYESKDFNNEVGFKAISRFGIGILSCFMVANKIEVSTKKENSEAIRFSIKSLYSYFITQLESIHRNVSPFPSSDDSKIEKYRKEIGTSIAIQIDFNKLNRWFEIKKELLRHIYYSPVEIQYKNEKIGTTIDELEKNPWIDEETIIELNEKDDSKIKSFFTITNMNERFKLRIKPIKLSDYSNNNKIKAQMVIVEVFSNILKVEGNIQREILIQRSFVNDESLELKLNRTNPKISHSSKSTRILLKNYKELVSFDKLTYSKLGHNGIFNTKDFSDLFNEKLTSITNSEKFVITHIYLSNEFRPSLDISRSKEINFDYKTISTVNLMMSKFITKNNLTKETYDCSLVRNRFSGNITYNEILNDENSKEWKEEKIFLLENDNYGSLKELVNKRIYNYPRIEHFNLDYIYKSHTRQMFVLILVSLFTDGYLDKKGFYYVEKIYEQPKEVNAEKYFNVGFFLKYEESIRTKLQLSYKHEYFSLNIEHPFSKWLLENAKALNDNYKGIFEDIKNTFNSYYQNEKFEKLDSLLRLLEKLKPNIIDDVIIKSIETLKEGS
ncbi:ATP-binding protein [Arcobacter roscoffensis]|uniref:ATP-binding protein n=2 Tax=Arcobacter roscoffensis TaxID=2961520 RepID=A0ABY5E5U3_9BACT|nr:ATP-binding protein [Arcobacter roscoffensis]UTJ07531.1 ATP-binding protein [Arcobacter roscoffensis]